ncbi:MAG: HIT family protein [Chromatiales bacterium]|jgi:histidine triad (HIT) family protein|nr:HIT family protein [Chromatiales bacterium]MDP6150146.1 HIT family protein [Gammaproteobacteria bacterium]MDP7094406.1 HIT family protein [Gammaproteobacteria bacterium]MDP7270899.1 HIT family protein [Gammaproteobacteria bacterium]HJP04741.1 HIT family protein [Gammaproteobacteria bacterium]
MTYDKDNIFAKILRGEMPAVKVYEDDQTLAFMDVMPQSPGHVLVIPKTEAEDLFDLELKAGTAVLRTSQRVAQVVQEVFQADGIMINQFNGPAAGQTVFHYHVHIVPRYEDVPLRRHSGDMEDIAVLEEQAAKIRQALGES